MGREGGGGAAAVATVFKRSTTANGESTNYASEILEILTDN
jgi:hypothetical protein